MKTDNDSELPPLAERRPALRRRALLAGVLVYDDGRHSFACTIRDFSESGARTTIPKGQLLPKNVFLINVRARTAHQAHLAWAGETSAGLNFVQSFDLDKGTEPYLAYLRRILNAHAK